jgi:hypothetical protein
VPEKAAVLVFGQFVKISGAMDDASDFYRSIFQPEKDEIVAMGCGAQPWCNRVAQRIDSRSAGNALDFLA